MWYQLSLKCHNKYGPQERYTIFSAFWNLGDLVRQRDYLLKQIKRSTKKTSTQISNTQGKQKGFSLSYYLSISETKRVCKSFFLATLDISEQMIKTAFRKKNDISCAGEERRGRHGVRKNEKPEEKEAILTPSIALKVTIVDVILIRSTWIVA